MLSEIISGSSIEIDTKGRAVTRLLIQPEDLVQNDEFTRGVTGAVRFTLGRGTRLDILTFGGG